MGLNSAYDILQLGEEVERVEYTGTVCSGDALPGGEPGGNDSPAINFVARFLLSLQNQYVNAYWAAIYRGVYRCNLVIKYRSAPENLCSLFRMPHGRKS